MDYHPWITDKTLLVTGAAGSIGAALCRRLLAYAPATLRCLNLTEHGLGRLARQLAACPTSTTIQYVLGSVLDRRLMDLLCTHADVVVHTAAYKFVEQCEANPCAAVQNNVAGTYQVLHAAKAQDVSRCLLISSDKAYQPCGVMGQTKHIAERLMVSLGAGFLTVRFGNVLDSAGSVFPLWREQIAAHGTVTLTDPACERYFMTCKDACTLIVETLRLPLAQGTFVFDMGPRQRLGDVLATFLAGYVIPVRIHVVGLRPGERLTEEIAGGPRRPTAHPQIFQVDAVASLSDCREAFWQLLWAGYMHDDTAARKGLAALSQGACA